MVCRLHSQNTKVVVERPLIGCRFSHNSPSAKLKSHPRACFFVLTSSSPRMTLNVFQI